MQNKFLLLTCLIFGLFSSAKAQDAYSRFLAEKPVMIQQLQQQRTQITDVVARKNVDLKLIALGSNSNDANVNNFNPLEIRMATAELYRDFYLKIGDAATAAKYDAAMLELKKSLTEQK